MTLKLIFTNLITLLFLTTSFGQSTNDNEKYDTVYYHDDLPKTITYKFDEKSTYTEVQQFEYYPNDSLKSFSFKTPTQYFENTYNKRGELIEQLEMEDKVVVFHNFVEYEYSKTDKIELLSVLNENNELQFYSVHQYNEDDEIEKIETREENDELISVNLFRYIESFDKPEEFIFNNQGQLIVANAYIRVDHGEELIPVKIKFEISNKNVIYAIRIYYAEEFAKVRGKSFTDKIHGFAVKPKYGFGGKLRKIYMTGHSYHGPKNIRGEKMINHPMTKFYNDCNQLMAKIRKEYKID